MSYFPLTYFFIIIIKRYGRWVAQTRSHRLSIFLKGSCSVLLVQMYSVGIPI